MTIGWSKYHVRANGSRPPSSSGPGWISGRTRGRFRYCSKRRDFSSGSGIFPPQSDAARLRVKTGHVSFSQRSRTKPSVHTSRSTADTATNALNSNIIHASMPPKIGSRLRRPDDTTSGASRLDLLDAPPLATSREPDASPRPLNPWPCVPQDRYRGLPVL